MDTLVATLHELGSGTADVEVDDESEHRVELQTVEERTDGFYAEGRDAEADNVLFRFTTPKTSDEHVTVERRHARDEEWETLGRLTDVAGAP